jgi:hypothetical protein
MLPLLVLAAALSALVAPAHGQFYVATRNAEAIGVVDAGNAVRDGDIVTASAIIAFAESQEEEGARVRVVHFIEEHDCRSGRYRDVGVATFTENLRLVSHDETPDAEWSDYDGESPRALAAGYLCHGKGLTLAGDDLATVLRAYWKSVGKPAQSDEI